MPEARTLPLGYKYKSTKGLCYDRVFTEALLFSATIGAYRTGSIGSRPGLQLSTQEMEFSNLGRSAGSCLVSELFGRLVAIRLVSAWGAAA